MDVSTISSLSALNTTSAKANVIKHKFYPWDNPDSIITQEQLSVVETTIACGLDPLMLIVGVPGNLISILVFRKRGLKDRMHMALFSLGLIDLCTVFFFFLLGSFCPAKKMFLRGSEKYVADWYKWQMRKYVRGGYVCYEPLDRVPPTRS